LYNNFNEKPNQTQKQLDEDDGINLIQIAKKYKKNKSNFSKHIKIEGHEDNLW